MNAHEVHDRFERFAREEAPGRSDVYARWAGAVVTDDALAGIIATFPDQRQQPPLIFAVARHLGCTGESGADFAVFLREHASSMRAELSHRSLQTNEPLRCAALVPALAQISGPITLIELGASGGLCLFPDRYAYRYTSARGVTAWSPDGGSSVMLESAWTGDEPPTITVPPIVRRIGVDLHPLDMTNADDAHWLRALVWPGEVGREERIAAASAIVAADPPLLITADALDGLDQAIAAAAPGSRIVVTTPGVLPYLPRARREELVTRLRAIDGHWITMDARGLHSGWVSSERPLPDVGFVLAIDGRVLGAVDPLGSWVSWNPDGV